MRKLVVRLGVLGVLSSAYVIGLHATSQVAQPRYIAYCCSSGNMTCCSYRGCSAGPNGCQNN
jgi:hypothetical protein